MTAATLTWHIRDSFVDYMATGEGTSGSNGAVAAAPSGSPPLVREYGFPVRDGWYDPAGGCAAVRFGGTVRFRYSAHGIDIETHDPELELIPGGARVVARFGGGSVTTPGRGTLAELSWSAPVVSGDTATWTQVPGTIPKGASTSVFAGFYFPGDEFGWFTLSLTAPAG